MNKVEQNEISHSFLKGLDLGEREQEVLEDAARRVGFVPEKVVGRSSWWGSSEIGAFHYVGEYWGKKAVLKVQGVKPSTSEIHMMNCFAERNKSQVIRPPHLYASLPWNGDKRYEALLLEYIGGPKVVQSPTMEGELKRFFELFKDYRANCLQHPWVDKPQTRISERIENSFAKWRETSFELYPYHPFRKEKDAQLIDEAVSILKEGYQDVEPEFQHGHFSANDLYQMGDHVVLLSNLYWSWKPPFYDAIFGYHWFIYNLSSINGITPEEVEKQRALWLGKIEVFPKAQGENSQLLKLALLERAAAGLNLDALSIDPNNPIAEYLVQATREQIGQLIATQS